MVGRVGEGAIVREREEEREALEILCSEVIV